MKIPCSVSQIAVVASLLAMTGCVPDVGSTTAPVVPTAAVASYTPPDASTLAALRAGAKDGNAEDQHQLGRYYTNTKDYSEALFWLGKSAARGSAAGENDLGYLYYAGLGVPQDYGKAAGWFTKAADQGYPPAEDNLGYMYGRGLGVPQNAPLAMTLLQRAQAKGDANAGGVMAVLGVQPPMSGNGGTYDNQAAPSALPAQDQQNDADDEQQREQQIEYEQQQQELQQRQQQEWWEQQQAQQQEQMQQQQEEQYQEQQNEQEEYQQQQDDENNAAQEQEQPEDNGGGD